jgi:exodeoxyribonuclease VII small subunit
MKKADKGTTFAAAYAELEDIIGFFERGDADLEEGIAKFERGLELADRCKARLAELENKVTQIKARFSGDANDAVSPA